MPEFKYRTVYYPLVNQMSNVPLLKNNPHGLWCCAVDSCYSNMEADEAGVLHVPFTHFIEVHKSTAWDRHKKVVFRVSEADYFLDRIQLGGCVMLDKKEVAEMRDLLNSFLEEMEAEEDEYPK